jgi:hypothetical protein
MPHAVKKQQGRELSRHFAVYGVLARYSPFLLDISLLPSLITDYFLRMPKVLTQTGGADFEALLFDGPDS